MHTIERIERIFGLRSHIVYQLRKEGVEPTEQVIALYVQAFLLDQLGG